MSAPEQTALDAIVAELRYNDECGDGKASDAELRDDALAIHRSIVPAMLVPRAPVEELVTAAQAMLDAETKGFGALMRAGHLLGRKVAAVADALQGTEQR